VILHGGVTPGSETDDVLQLAYAVNIVLGVFNLLPIPPLDGSRIVAAAMNEATYVRWAQLDQYGMIAIFALLFVFRDPWYQFFNSALEHTSNVIEALAGG
jgi:Zn-dependent protease